jgi:hypothetical protein
MLQLYTQLDSEQHEVIRSRPELWHWLQREFPGQNLFLYRHRVEGTFVIGQRMPDGKFCDVLGLGNKLHLDRDRAAHLRFLFSSHNTKDFLIRMMKAGYGNQISRMQDTADADSARIQRRMSTRTSIAV